MEFYVSIMLHDLYIELAMSFICPSYILYNKIFIFIKQEFGFFLSFNKYELKYIIDAFFLNLVDAYFKIIFKLSFYNALSVLFNAS